jgi:hypothetical protein
MAGIGGFIFSVHLEHVCINIIAKFLTITPNIAEDITVRHYKVPKVPVKKGNINEAVSDSKN